MKDYGLPLTSLYEGSPEPTWYYDGWFPVEDRTMVVTGDGGVGKSLLLMHLMFSMLLRRDFMGKPYGLDHTPRFLYFDLDMGRMGVGMHMLNVLMGLGVTQEDADSLEDQVAVVCDGMEGVPAGFDLGSSNSHDILKGMLEYTKPDICIAESMTDLCGTRISLNNNNDLNAMLRRLQRVRPETAWWMVHHETKSKYEGDGKTKKAVQHRGAGGFALTKSFNRSISLRRSRLIREKDGTTWNRNVVEWGKVRYGLQPRRWFYEFGGVPMTFRYGGEMSDDEG